MKNSFKNPLSIIHLVLLLLHPIRATEEPSKREDPRIKCSVESVKPFFQNWITVCDRISEIANYHLIPLLALQSNVGNDNPRTLTEQETQKLCTWQDLQETINNLTLEGVDLATSPVFRVPPPYSGLVINDPNRDALRLTAAKRTVTYHYNTQNFWPQTFKAVHQFEYNANAPQDFVGKLKNVREQILSAITLQFQLILPPLSEGREFQREVDVITKDSTRTEEELRTKEGNIIKFCQQKCLNLTFEINGLEEKFRFINLQIKKFLEEKPIKQKFLDKLIFESKVTEGELTAANAQIDLARNTIEILYLQPTLEFAFSELFKEAQPVRTYNKM